MAGKPSIWAKGQAIVKSILLSDNTVAEGVAIVDADGNQITNFGGSAGLTDAQLRAAPVPVSGTVAVSGVATAGNQATEIAGLASIDGHVDGIEGLLSAPLTVTGPLTDTQLRNTPVPVSGTVATGALTDTQLRATTVPVNLYDTDVGLSQGMTALRDAIVAQRYTVLADSIADGLASFWKYDCSNGGFVSVVVGEGLFTTSASATGWSQLTSTNVIYYPGQVTWFNSAIRLGDTGSAGNVRRWGVFTVAGTTPQDGYYYELSGTTLNAVSCKAGVATAVASTSWTKFSTNPFTLDTNYHQFEIRYTANSVHFLIDNILRHTASGGASPITQTLDFPMTIHTVNSSGATDRQIAVRNCGIGRFGTPDQVRSTNSAPEGSLVQPMAGVIGGWDGMSVRAATVRQHNGKSHVYTRDDAVLSILSEILEELRVLNGIQEGEYV